MAEHIEVALFYKSSESSAGLMRVIFYAEQVAHRVVASNLDACRRNGKKDIDSFSLLRLSTWMSMARIYLNSPLSLWYNSFTLSTRCFSRRVDPGNCSPMHVSLELLSRYISSRIPSFGS
jgi:hypothetical protein